MHIIAPDRSSIIYTLCDGTERFCVTNFSAKVSDADVEAYAQAWEDNANAELVAAQKLEALQAVNTMIENA